MPLLRGCCSLDLQVGTKIIGVICLILALLGFLFVLVNLGVYLILKDFALQQLHFAFEQQGFTLQEMANVTDVSGFKEDNDIGRLMLEYLENNTDIVTIVILVLLCQQLHDVICCSCLIHGIRKNKRGLLMPWIVTQVLYILIEAGIVVLFFVIIGYFPPLYKLILPVITFYLLWIALHIYLTLVVISQFQALGLIRMHDEMCMK